MPEMDMSWPTGAASAPGRPTTPDDLASRFTTKQRTPPRVMIYGYGGTGKTTAAALLATSCPHLTVRFVSTEGGEAAGVTSAPASTYAECMAFAEAVGTPALPGDVLVVDTLSAVQEFAIAEVMREREITDMEGVDYGKAWQGLVQKMTDFRAALTNAWNRGVGIVLVAHQTTARVVSRESNDFIATVPDLYEDPRQGSVRRAFFNWCSVVLALEDTTDATRGKLTTIGERGFHTQGKPHLMAKSREPLPAWIPFPAEGDPPTPAPDALDPLWTRLFPEPLPDVELPS